jgi:electron transport complex protein RnfB
MTNDNTHTDRREFIRTCCRLSAVGALATVGGMAVVKSDDDRLVWQLNPSLCTQCGKCATACVLAESAVKCSHTHSMCGYCTQCFGFFQPNVRDLDEGAENQLCPTGALERKFIEEPYFEYNVELDLCIGCSKCVKSCKAFGNGSLRLQVMHSRCLNCNECAIAKACPADAFNRVPASQTYVLEEPEES